MVQPETRINIERYRARARPREHNPGEKQQPDYKPLSDCIGAGHFVLFCPSDASRGSPTALLKKPGFKV
jgi:hypothetical protein